MSEFPCPCGASSSYEKCCGLIHADISNAMSAEQLMRSRYSAFVLEQEDYLLQSWHPDTRPSTIEFDPKSKWLGLKVKDSQAGLESDTEGRVAFIARCRVSGKAQRIVENSHFIKVEGIWYYHSALDP